MDKTFIVLLLFTLVSCGKEVSISTQTLEANAAKGDSTVKAQEQNGTLKRGTPDMINSYPVSIYSSRDALEFIAAKPMTTQMSVVFKGKVVNREMVLETIVAQ